jgi:CBS domain-containing protein
VPRRDIGGTLPKLRQPLVCFNDLRRQPSANDDLVQTDGPAWDVRKVGVLIGPEVAMKVRDIMTREVISCQKETDLATAARLMLIGHFGTLPIVDGQGRLAGIITDRDIAMAAAARDRSATHIAVYEAMTPLVRRCFTDDGVDAVLKQMAEARIRRLPVIDPDGRLTGLVSLDDIVQRALDRPGGVSSVTFVQAMRQICSRPTVEPDLDSVVS